MFPYKFLLRNAMLTLPKVAWATYDLTVLLTIDLLIWGPNLNAASRDKNSAGVQQADGQTDLSPIRQKIG